MTSDIAQLARPATILTCGNGRIGHTEPRRRLAAPRGMETTYARGALMAQRTCAVDGCERPTAAWGWCKTHYARWRKTGDVQAHIPIQGSPRVCIIEGCARKFSARGYCASHYHRLQQTGELGEVHFRPHGKAKVRDELGRKQCHVCAKWLPVEGFHAAQNQSDGLATRCRECKRWDKLLSNFGIGRAQYEAMHAAQKGRCAICQEPPSGTLNVDHDHLCCPEKGKSCGKCVRALLCADCNRAIGMMQDDPSILRAAAAYLEGHRG